MDCIGHLKCDDALSITNWPIIVDKVSFQNNWYLKKKKRKEKEKKLR